MGRNIEGIWLTTHVQASTSALILLVSRLVRTTQFLLSLYGPSSNNGPDWITCNFNKRFIIDFFPSLSILLFLANNLEALFVSDWAAMRLEIKCNFLCASRWTWLHDDSGARCSHRQFDLSPEISHRLGMLIFSLVFRSFEAGQVLFLLSIEFVLLWNLLEKVLSLNCIRSDSMGNILIDSAEAEGD